MQVFRKSILMLLACVAAGLSGVSSVRADVDIDAKAKGVAKSLVIIDFTLRNENNSREDSGQGILLSKEGVILISGSLINEGYPKEWISEIKVRLPGKNFSPVPATLLGRTRNRAFAYLKTEKPVDAPPFETGDMADIKIGQEVFGVAILGKTGGYETYIGKSQVRAVVELNHTLGSTASFGLTRGTSPVFDVTTGAFVGITVPSLGESMMMQSPGGGGARRIELVDEDQSSTFYPVSEVKSVLKEVPTQPFDLRRAWLGVEDVTGLQEDVRIQKKIEQTAGVIIGTVIPDEAADKAGLKAGDIVLTVDGKEFSKNPVPEMMVMHFVRVFDDMKPGDKVTLGILRAGKKMDIPETLAESPKISAEMPHVFSAKIGLLTRDLVFADAYTRHLPQDTKGVMVVLVKNGAPAALGTTPLQRDFLITKVDDQPVSNQKEFLDIIKQEGDKPDLKEMVFVVILPSGETQVCRVDLK